MNCPLCGSQITRYFYYSRTDEEGQFQFRIANNVLLLDFHVVKNGNEKPKKKNYDQIVLGPARTEIFTQLIDLLNYFPLYLKENNLGSYVSFETSTKTAKFKPRFGGLILKYNEKKDQVLFLDISGIECFSLPRNIVQHNLLNAFIDLQNGFARAQK